MFTLSSSHSTDRKHSTGIPACNSQPEPIPSTRASDGAGGQAEDEGPGGPGGQAEDEGPGGQAEDEGPGGPGGGVGIGWVLI